jgi:hypothetical protein
MSSAYNKFNCFAQDVTDKLHNFNSDTFNICLTNTAPVATNTVYSNISDLSTANGYTAGGTAIGSTANSQSSGTDSFTGDNVVFTASGGSIGPFRYAVLYNATASGKNLIAWWDYGSSITLSSGETMTVSGTASSGVIFTLV